VDLHPHAPAATLSDADREALIQGLVAAFGGGEGGAEGGDD